MTILHQGSRGPAVKRLQTALRSNKYGRYYTGAIDGIFGPATAHGIWEAKWFLGYRREMVNRAAGALLPRILLGTQALTAGQRIRRRVRLDRLKNQPLRLKILAVATDEIGTRETGWNHIKYNEWWGWGAIAYCVVGVSWCAVKAGSTAFVRGVRWAGTDSFLADARARRNGIRLVSDPLPGDCGVIDFDGHTDPDHALVVERVEGDFVHTIEFNTIVGSFEGVARKVRPRHHCWFIRAMR